MSIEFLRIYDASDLDVKMSGTLRPATGDAININSSGEGRHAQNTAGANRKAHGIVEESGTKDGKTLSLVRRARCKDTGAAFTQGGDLYLGLVGKLTQTQPSASTELIQRMGFALNATEFVLDVENETSTVA